MLLLANLTDMPVPLFVIGGAIAIVAIVSGCFTKIIMVRNREKTRREIAAYVAEGTIEPDKAIEMLKAGYEAEKDD